MSHKINFKDLKDFEISQVIAATSGHGENKRIMVIANTTELPYFRIYNHNEIVRICFKLKDAVDCYNNI